MAARTDFIIKRGTLEEYVGSGGEAIVPSGVERIAPGAFRRGRALVRVVLPSGLREIPARLFEGCDRLREAVLPASLRFMGQSAFARCAALESVVLPDALASVERNAFLACGALAEVRLPLGLERVEDGAFAECRSLAAIEFPSALKRVGGSKADGPVPLGAFQACGLTRLVIPASVETIGAGAFRDCLRLKSVRIGSRSVRVGAGAFEGCPRLRRLSVPLSAEIFETQASPAGATSAAPESAETAAAGASSERGDFGMEDAARMRASRVADAAELENGAVGAPEADSLQDPDPQRAALAPGLQEGNPLGEAGTGRGVGAPEGFLRRTSPLPASLVKDLAASGVVEVGAAEAAAMFCFQPEELSRFAGGILEKDLRRALPALYDELRTRRTPRAMLRVAALLTKRAPDVSFSALMSFYRLFLKAAAPIPAMRAAEAAFRDDPKTGLETACADLYAAEYADAAFKSADLPADSPALGRVRYAGSDRAASPHVVKCLLLPYLLPPADLGADDPCSPPGPRISGVSMEIERRLRREDLERMAGDLFPLDLLEERPHWLAPFCRFAGELGVSRLNSLARRTFPPGSHAAEQARYALALSDTREAMCCSAEHPYAGGASFLYYYCKLRGVKEPPLDGDLRLHTDRDGLKTWNIEGKTVSMRLGDDLRFRWEKDGVRFEDERNFGLSEGATEALRAELSIKQARADELIEEDARRLESAFLKATPLSFSAFQRLYLDDFLRRRLIEGVVWTQGDDAFAVGPRSLVRSDGSVFIPMRRPVRMAHPMEMTGAEREAWRKYLSREGKTPIVDQLGEYLQDPSTPIDRYNGCLISKEGRRAFEEAFGCARSHPDRLQTPNNSFSITCRELPAGGGALRLGSFYASDFDRLANRALNLLDKLTIESRIARDDPRVLRLIERFNFGPEKRGELLRAAMDAEASGLTAALLEQNRALGLPADDLRLD